MFVHALTFAGSGGSCLITRLLGRVFKHLPKDLANMCDRGSCIFYLIPTKFALKMLLKAAYSVTMNIFQKIFFSF